jgi:hypothetical protein
MKILIVWLFIIVVLVWSDDTVGLQGFPMVTSVPTVAQSFPTTGPKFPIAAE